MDRYNLGFLTGSIYSTEENLYGSWVDGSPIYQKVLEIESIPKGISNILLDFTGMNVNELIEYKIVAKFTSGDIEYTVNDYYSSSTEYLYCFKRDNYLMANAGRAYTDVKVIIRYTKSSS